MRIRVSQPALVPDLVEFLGRAFCTTESVHGSVLEVALPSVSDSAARGASSTSTSPPGEACIRRSRRRSSTHPISRFAGDSGVEDAFAELGQPPLGELEERARGG